MSRGVVACHSAIMRAWGINPQPNLKPAGVPGWLSPLVYIPKGLFFFFSLVSVVMSPGSLPCFIRWIVLKD